MRNLKWVSLNDAERGQLVAIWLLAADHDGVIPASPELVQKLCFMSSIPDLNKFIDLGFLDGERRHDGVTMASGWRQDDVLETETETDIEKHLGSSDDAPKDEPKESASGYTPEFEAAWKDYPKRRNNNPKQGAFNAWNARIRQGVKPEEMHAGVKRYFDFCYSTGKIGTEFVMQGSKFFGKLKCYADDWGGSDKLTQTDLLMAGSEKREEVERRFVAQQQTRPEWMTGGWE